MKDVNIQGQLDNQPTDLDVHRQQTDTIVAEVLSISRDNQIAIAELNNELVRIVARLDSVPQNKHAEHHTFIGAQILAHEARTKFWTEQRSRITTAGIWAAIGIVGTAVWFLAQEFLTQRGIL